jgi:hypothetical protein
MMWTLHRSVIRLAMLFALIALLCSCNLPTTTPSKPNEDNRTASIANDNFLGRLESGDLVLDEIAITTEDTQGRIVRVILRNSGTEEIVVSIPCGLYFTAEDESMQRMMVIQSEPVTILPGSSGVLEPYVICIDSDLSTPTSDTSYRIGMLTSDELLQLAQCLCSLDLDEDGEAVEVPEGGGALGLQFAVWAVSNDMFSEGTEERFGEATGALNTLLGEELGEGLGGLITAFVELFRESARPWLDYCGIPIKP